MSRTPTKKKSIPLVSMAGTGSFLLAIWGVFFLQIFSNLSAFGIRPRSLEGLWGVFMSPLLHGNFAHISANSLSLIFLSPFFFWVVGNKRYIFFEIWILSGLITWLIGRPESLHIGASSVIFGMIGLLMGTGFFDRNFKAISISALAFMLYGGSLWGLLPANPMISWEGHLGGFVAGLVTARYSLSDRS